MISPALCSTMNYQQLAETIARNIFKEGDQPSRGIEGTVQRMAFKGGTYPDAETDLGGYCEAALATSIYECLNREHPLPKLADDWQPTADNVNALPEPLRKYIHDIETLCDPGYLVQQLAALQDQAAPLMLALEKALAEAKANRE